MKKIETMEKKSNLIISGKKLIRDNLWYFLIALLSIVVLVLFPMIGSGLPLNFSFPNSVVGWIIYIFSKLAVATINICIFHSFMEQGKLNVSTYWKKIIADEILHKIKQKKETRPLSPEEWLKKEYTSKGISLTITSVLSCIVLSQVILTFDVMTFISFLLVLVIGIVFGVMQLFKSEEFWSLEYYDYAIWYLAEYNKDKEPEYKLKIIDKKLYEGDQLIYECK